MHESAISRLTGIESTEISSEATQLQTRRANNSQVRKGLLEPGSFCYMLELQSLRSLKPGLLIQDGVPAAKEKSPLQDLQGPPCWRLRSA